MTRTALRAARLHDSEAPGQSNFVKDQIPGSLKERKGGNTNINSHIEVIKSSPDASEVK